MAIITSYNLKYDAEELEKWRSKSIKNELGIVSDEEYLGDKYGYGYGEFWVERYLISNGYKVISGKYNLSTEKSKYQSNNEIIKNAIGEEKYRILTTRFKEEVNKGKGRIEQSDIFAYKENEVLFVEVKKDKDKLRTPQTNFIKLVVENLNIPFALFNLQSNCLEENKVEMDIE